MTDRERQILQLEFEIQRLKRIPTDMRHTIADRERRLLLLQS